MRAEVVAKMLAKAQAKARAKATAHDSGACNGGGKGTKDTKSEQVSENRDDGLASEDSASSTTAVEEGDSRSWDDLKDAVKALGLRESQ